MCLWGNGKDKKAGRTDVEWKETMQPEILNRRIKNCWFRITAIISDLDSIVLTGIEAEEGKKEQYLKGE
jgi:hypothetical protein